MILSGAIFFDVFWYYFNTLLDSNPSAHTLGLLLLLQSKIISYPPVAAQQGWQFLLSISPSVENPCDRFFQPPSILCTWIKERMHACRNRRGYWHASTVPWKFPKRPRVTAGLTGPSARGLARALRRTEQLSHAILQPWCRRDWQAEPKSECRCLHEKCSVNLSGM